MLGGYISVSEFKMLNPHLDFSNYSDAVISGLIDTCSRLVDLEIGYSIPIETIAGEKIPGAVNSNGDLEVWVRKFPVVSLNALKIVKGTTVLTLSLEANGSKKYDFPANNAPPIVYAGAELSYASTAITPSSLRGKDWYFEVDYRAGYETVPTPIKHATSYLVKDIMSEQYNVGGFTSIRQGQISYTRSVTDRYLLPDRALRLLRPYKRVW